VTSARVLVVEDNVKNMKLFRDVLEAAGFRTLAATTAGSSFSTFTRSVADIAR